MIRALYLLFVLSGAAGLIYESIWTRYLGLFVGHDAYAQIIVLVIFLGGMSAGAMAVSRRSERLAQPLYGYVAIEFAVGVIGLFFHDVFQGATAWAYASVYPGARRLLAAARGQVGHRQRADPAPVGAARRNLSADVGGSAAARPKSSRAARSRCSTSPTAWARPRACSSQASTWYRSPGCRERCSRRRCSTSSSPARRSA